MRYFHLLILLLALAVLAMVVDRRGLPWSGESLDPCTEPLAWHIGTVDPRFGLSEDQVRGAVLEAAAKWEAAGGRPYFRPDTTGMAIDLVYDHRQESMETHGSAERRVRDLGDRTASYRARVESLRERLEADRATHERQRTDATARRLQASVDRHNQA
ncbi:MAG TPA: hypothetical protein VK966_02845, partial [Longimicrobiales bacterium]|nr:hypothetical protein [Longimicrobiales bacterium]